MARNTNLPQLSRHEAGMAEAATGGVRRGEQGEARSGNNAPRGGPLLELSWRRLKIRSKSDASDSLVQEPTHLGQYMYSLYTHIMCVPFLESFDGVRPTELQPRNPNSFPSV